METIESIKQKLVGIWEYEDGRIIEFKLDGQFVLTPRNGVKPEVQGKFLFSQKNEGQITFSNPLFEPLCIFESITIEKFTYFDVALDGSKSHVILTKQK